MPHCLALHRLEMASLGVPLNGTSGTRLRRRSLRVMGHLPVQILPDIAREAGQRT